MNNMEHSKLSFKVLKQFLSNNNFNEKFSLAEYLPSSANPVNSSTKSRIDVLA